MGPARPAGIRPEAHRFPKSGSAGIGGVERKPRRQREPLLDQGAREETADAFTSIRRPDIDMADAQQIGRRVIRIWRHRSDRRQHAFAIHREQCVALVAGLVEASTPFLQDALDEAVAFGRRLVLQGRQVVRQGFADPDNLQVRWDQRPSNRALEM